MPHAPVFVHTYEDYLQQIGRLDLTAVRDRLGFHLDGGQAVIPLLGRLFRVSAEGIRDAQDRKPNLAVCVILAKYLLMCPGQVPAPGPLATFKDFKDAAPLIGYFADTVEGTLARRFTGRLGALETACRKLGGERHDADWAYQLKLRLPALPKVPLFLLFNDAEEGFPAQCIILFEDAVQYYLDMESVAMLGSVLVRFLD